MKAFEELPSSVDRRLVGQFEAFVAVQAFLRALDALLESRPAEERFEAIYRATLEWLDTTCPELAEELGASAAGASVMH